MLKSARMSARVWREHPLHRPRIVTRFNGLPAPGPHRLGDVGRRARRVERRL